MQRTLSAPSRPNGKLELVRAASRTIDATLLAGPPATPGLPPSPHRRDTLGVSRHAGDF